MVYMLGVTRYVIGVFNCLLLRYV